MTTFASKLKLYHVHGSYYKICGDAIIDLSSIFTISSPSFFTDSLTAKFKLETEFGASVTIVLEACVDDVDIKSAWKNSNRDKLVFESFIKNLLNDFILNTLTPVISKQRSIAISSQK